ncbi:MAG: Exonuclease RNase and polymerase [Myxococcales bacterium]|nr:Exonuclease RNase and polymerase [Myxococcales bacterium]
MSLFEWRPEPGSAREPAGTVDARQDEPTREPASKRTKARRSKAGPVAAPEPGCEAAVAAPVEPVGELAAGSHPVTAPVAGPVILVFDCETTGTDRVRDQVIELCVQRGLADNAPSRVWRIKPSVPIHPGAQAVHGISIDELADCPTFDAVATEITELFATADVIVGYNLAFDIDMLQAEYARIGKPLLDFSTTKIVDAFRLWQQCEPRSLQHAHQRFVGGEFAAAHTASADVAATGRVLAGMLKHFDLDGQDWDQIATKCDPQAGQRASWVGPSRHLRWEGEVVVLGFGKHGGAPVHELAAGPDRSFLKWVVEKDFPVHVAEVCKAALELQGDAFLSWARDRYGVPAPTAQPPFAK